MSLNLTTHAHRFLQALCTAAATLLFIAAPAAWSATITFEDRVPSFIYFNGPIQQGDAQTLLRLLAGRPRAISSLHLNSPGGSLQEALQLAKVVEKAGLATRVAQDGICASACFFVWLAGTSRFANSREAMLSPRAQEALRSVGSPPGYVGLHRPFERIMQAPDGRQAQLMRGVTEYLESKMVPRRLIDAMMTHPSNDIYWMTNQDLKEVGEYAPAIEEFLIQRCGYDRNYAEKLTEAMLARNQERVAQIEAAQDRVRSCEVEETRKLIDRGQAEIRNGWRP